MMNKIMCLLILAGALLVGNGILELAHNNLGLQAQVAALKVTHNVIDR